MHSMNELSQNTVQKLLAFSAIMEHVSEMQKAALSVHPHTPSHRLLAMTPVLMGRTACVQLCASVSLARVAPKGDIGT